MNMFTNNSGPSGRRILAALLSGTGAALILAFLVVLGEFSREGRRVEFSFTDGIWSFPGEILCGTFWGMIGVAIGTCVGVWSGPPGAFLKGFCAGAVPFVFVFFLGMLSASPGTSHPPGCLAFLLVFLLTSLPSGLAAQIGAGGHHRTKTETIGIPKVPK
jgi:hypothetical protein